MSEFDEMAESDAGPDDSSVKMLIGLFALPPCLSSVESELTECMDLARELSLFQMGEDTNPVVFVDAPDEDEPEVAPRPPGPPSEVDVMVAARLDEALKPWRQRIALSRELGRKGGCSWPTFKRACVEYGMTPGESADQLLAMLKPYHPEWSNSHGH
jgi:hypothetical protein